MLFKSDAFARVILSDLTANQNVNWTLTDSFLQSHYVGSQML
jgi:hypothetical protein